MHDNATENREVCEITCTPHPSKKKRLLISVDQQPWRDVDLYFFQNHKEAIESCRSLEVLENLLLTIELTQARKYALNRIAKQATPKKSLERSLSQRAVTSQTIQTIISDFESKGYVNDQDWANSFVRQQKAKKVGPRAIAQKLAFKGLGKETIEEALGSENSEDQSIAIVALLQTKYRQRNLNDFKERNKVIAALLRRGFEFDEILKNLS